MLNRPLNNIDPDGEWVLTALIALGNMWLNGAMINNFQFNPAKWDWRSPKNWVSLVQSVISGYAIGSTIENQYRLYKLNRIEKRATDVEYLQQKV